MIGLIEGCSSTVREPPAAPASQTSAPSPSVSRKPGDDPARAQVQISDEIRRACGLSNEDAYFAFDSAKVEPHDRELLGKVARCFESGALAGRQMKLVGHADPRGEAEYNTVLGGRRADSVATAIVGQGLSRQRISSSSRGAQDATGTDEASWARDRRVDVLL